MRTSVTAFAPATVANVAVGFDILGFALEGVGDTITVRRVENPDPQAPIRIVQVSPDLPNDPYQNTATAGLLKLRKDLKLKFGMDVSIQKGIPVQSGMGGSAASAVGAIVAGNGLLPYPLGLQELLPYALIGEKAASAAEHWDNIAACLFGGLTLVYGKKSQVVSLPVPDGLFCVLVHPHLKVGTASARAILRPTIFLEEHVLQSACLGGVIAGCFRNDLDLIQTCLHDWIIEPQREKLIEGFSEVKNAALSQGALGCSISGSGPSVFAWSRMAHVDAICQAMVEAFQKRKIGTDSWISPISQAGARIL